MPSRSFSAAPQYQYHRCVCCERSSHAFVSCYCCSVHYSNKSAPYYYCHRRFHTPVMKEFRSFLCRYVKLKFLFREARSFVRHVEPPERSEFLHRGTDRRVSPLKRALCPAAFTSGVTDPSPRCAIIVPADSKSSTHLSC